MNPHLFVSDLSKVHLPNVFNPYVDVCAAHDCSDAPNRRRKNLEAMICGAIESKVDTIWVARDLGYRGGRRTGIALTDEPHLEEMSRLYSGIHLEKATIGPQVSERTASVIWNVISRISQPVFLWNVFPFHPHEADKPFSNRSHTKSERKLALPFLHTLIALLGARRLIAVGKDAESALRNIGLPVSVVRHPSYGGQTEFLCGIESLYKLPDCSAHTLPLLEN